jgi:PKD repeat protein
MTPRSWLARGAAVVLGLALGACESLPNVPPTAGFVLSPVSPIYAGETAVVFNASPSRDSDGRIASYAWNFGDGTAEVTTSDAVVTHVFPDTPARCVDVTYTVLLTVRDDGGEQSSVDHAATVTERPAPGTPECTATR